MKKSKKTFGFLIVFSMLLAACSSVQTSALPTPTAIANAVSDQATNKPVGEEDTNQEALMGENLTQTTTMDENPSQMPMMEATSPAGTMQAPSGETMMEDHSTPTPENSVPDWLSFTLTDVRSGEAFTFNDFNGKVVLVETMAVWCSNCFQQQKQVVALHAALGERDDFLSVGLDIDPNEGPDTLKNFVDQNGFDWKYAVSSKDLSRQLASLYGDQFLNPPSTPMLIIDRKGGVHPLPFGIKSADKLQQALEPFLDEGM